MFGLAIKVLIWFYFETPVAFLTALKIVVLAFTADPATFRKVKLANLFGFNRDLFDFMSCGTNFVIQNTY